MGPVEGYRGNWIRTASFKATSRLPFALARFGLMPRSFDVQPRALARVGSGVEARLPVRRTQ